MTEERIKLVLDEKCAITLVPDQSNKPAETKVANSERRTATEDVPRLVAPLVEVGWGAEVVPPPV